MTTDPFGIITDVNKQMEALTGCTRDELIGAPFKDCFTDPERAETCLKQVLIAKSVTDFELTARARDGKETVVSYNATTLYDRSRTLKGVFAAARDVTDRNRVELELRDAKAAAESANRMKSDFLASMSHEIRTPMNSIMGIADLLAKTSLSPEQDKFVQIFRRSGDNLLNLINDILDLSKVEASQLDLEHQSFALQDHLEKVIEMVAPRATDKGLTLICDVDAVVENELVGDPARLRQVLVNLLGNAIKFTQSGCVSLKVEAEGGDSAHLRFIVSDTGIGIAEDVLPLVFERFTQADSSTTRRFGGSGLGLTISKRLVELMEGSISAESTVGEGSIFTFTVPFDIAVAGALPTASPEGLPLDAAPEAMRPLRILMAEDSADNRTIVLAYLEDAPYRIDAAENGAIACELFIAEPYDLVLMDRQMPILDGLAATRNIRAWELENGRRPTPIIALTASALKGDRETCLAAGCTAYLTKPIKQDVLLQAIGHYAAVSLAEAADSDKKPVSRHQRRVAELTPEYLQNCRRDLLLMQEALVRADYQALSILGHQMRGSGGSFGFQEITDCGGHVEDAALNEDAAGSRVGVIELSEYLDRIQPSPGCSETP